MGNFADLKYIDYVIKSTKFGLGIELNNSLLEKY